MSDHKARIAELEQGERPAQASEPEQSTIAPRECRAEPVTPEQIRQALERGARDARIVAGDPVLPFPTTVGEVRALESALRECRAELELAKELLGAKHPRYREYWAQLESARAERDAEFLAKMLAHEVLEIVRAERDAALTRVEELHAIKPLLDAEKLTTALARIAELEKRCAAYERGAADHLETRACIAQTVAELEKARKMAPGRYDDCLKAALEALR